MDRPARVVAVEHLGGHQLRVTFGDGLVRELDLAGVLRGGVFAALEDPAYFAQAVVDPVAGTVCWPNGVDFDPDVLHGDYPPASGEAPCVLREYRLRPTG
jgi:hypothetical protein